MKYRYLTILFLIVILWTGCTKKLDLVSQDTLSDGTFWKTADDFKSATNDLYNGLERFGFEDTQSDIAFNDPNSVSNGTYQTSETSSLWTNSYVYIRRANTILEKGSSFTDSRIKRYLAEAKFFRAYNYWKMLRVYGGVPLIQKVSDVNDPELYKSRSSRTETVDFILADLADVAKNLPTQKELSNIEIGRVTKGAALAMAARVALFEGTWEKFRNEANANKYLDLAASSALEVMNSAQYSLFNAKGDQSYRYLFIEAGDDSPECILDRRYERNVLGHDMPYEYNGTGYNPTKKLADMYLDRNGLPITNQSSVFHGYNTFTSEYLDRDPRMTMTMIIPGTLTNRVFYSVTKVENWPNSPQRKDGTGYILYKYMSEDAAANNSGMNGDASLFDYDRHLIRYAEVLLIYAEAKYERNGNISDEDLNKSINLLRDRVNMPHLTNAFVSTNSLNMREEIRRERTIELALEGFRYDDLRRWKIAETEMSQDVKGIKIKGTDWEHRAPYSGDSYQKRADENGFITVETQRTFNPNKHYWQPLPTKEVAFYLENGYKLEQNPGW